MKFLSTIVLGLSLLLLTGAPSEGARRSGVKLDKETKKCLRCHKGDSYHLRSEEHLLGMKYKTAAKKNPTLRPYKELDERLTFKRGRVGCTTCHTAFMEERHKGVGPMLIMNNLGSTLCLACHLK